MLQFFLLGIFILVAIGGLYWRWQRQIAEEIAEGAEIEWAFLRKNEPEFLGDMTEQQFRDIYRRVHTPRFPAYALGMVATFFVSLPLTLGVLSLAKSVGIRLGLLPEPLEVVRGVALGDVRVTQAWQCTVECQLYIAEAFGGFFYFFGVVVVWLLVVFFFMRRFHANRPGYLRDEIIRAQER